MSEYIEKTMEWIKRTNPGQGVFVQAATEVLNSLEPLIKREQVPKTRDPRAYRDT